jgi:hypothetical protein
MDMDKVEPFVSKKGLELVVSDKVFQTDWRSHKGGVPTPNADSLDLIFMALIRRGCSMDLIAPGLKELHKRDMERRKVRVYCGHKQSSPSAFNATRSV